MSGKFKFAIDRGGTFTDIYAQCPNGEIRVMKLLSVDPDNYPDAPREGIRRILEEETRIPMPPSEKIDGSLIEWIRMGTTVATNALLERKGERMALLVTKGFKDVLFIGNQARPKIFDLEIVMPGVLYEDVVEVDCRVIPALDGKCHLKQEYPRIIGKTGEPFLITKTLEEDHLMKQLMELKGKGIKSLAVVLMHSYTCVDDELLVGKLAEQAGFDHVSLSHQIMPMVRIVPRGFTACADAYLTPHIKKYVQGFASGFKDELKDVNVLFMQSDGGLTPMDMFNGSRAVLSGPAGGVVGYAVTTPGPDPVIGFDMGGTSTDVSRYAGTYEHVFESTTAGVTIQAPQLDVNTVAAGGGSCLFFRSGLFVVGPESAGAHPGPVCYCKGGPLTVTDANLVLGRLLPQYFPKIFGPDGKQPLDKDATVREFTKLTLEINQFLETQKQGSGAMSVEEVAMGFIRVANEAMCRPIRALTQAKGYDTQQHTLACFGGAGAQHACAVARALGMTRVAIHKYAGILSAFGMACADVVQEAQVPAAKTYEPDNFAYLDEQLSTLAEQCVAKLSTQGFAPAQMETEPYLHLRYAGTDCALMCGPAKDSPSPTTKHGDFKKTFLDKYQSEFGFTIPDRTILVDDIRVRGIGKSLTRPDFHIEKASGTPAVDTTTSVFFEGQGYVATPVYLMAGLRGGHQIAGPAVVMDQLSTIVVEPDCSAVVTDSGDLLINIGSGQRKLIGTELDPIQLSIFSHRFMSIAEQMGRVLQRTSISTNIKERLDFSCALFGPDGGLVSNAPHIPVHLGAMQETVQYQMKVVGDNFQEGDVILSNHPKAGGSHLPDLTVITPVFYKTVKKPVFFVASRGHHADIGGITPGSMPPHSKSLLEEGATFKSFFLVKQGRFCEEEVTEALMAPGNIPGSSGTRNLKDNLSDLKAQIAANQKGINLMRELIDFYGLNVVQAYMGHIQRNAELAVRDMLRDIARVTPGRQLTATEHLDDGSPISLTVSLDEGSGSAVCDFSGTGPEVWGNCNAPRAITLSALIYCLRCMVGRDVPLNQGCLNPVRTVIPEGSLLDPSDDAGVVGGNVQTSQRIVDVVFKAFNTCAASQGCMNNVTFGHEGWGYYETVAGGAGAGPGWHGRSGVHTHMTNTRITDPEVLEVRYPVVLQRFSLRQGSGGGGRFRGGDGVIRELLFRAPMTLSILTERRVFAPYGLEGGMPGTKGLNLMLKADGRVVYLGSKTAINVEPGDVFQLFTPGGGGWGEGEGELEGEGEETTSASKALQFMERGSVFEYRKAQEPFVVGSFASIQSTDYQDFVGRSTAWMFGKTPPWAMVTPLSSLATLTITVRSGQSVAPERPITSVVVQEILFALNSMTAPALGEKIVKQRAKSHEDLLRSHLQLDANRNAKLQNELQRLADENKKLRRYLDDAQQDIKDKEDEIEDLKKKLREQPRTTLPPEHFSVPDDRQRVFEIDGKPVTLDQILNHFAGVIQKHHDLLNKKNKQIDDLEDALKNRPTEQPKSMRHAETHMVPPREDGKQGDFAKELALIRKEYEQVKHILTDRNNKLENLIEDLRRKLDQYADEIGHLRKELAARGMDPNDNTMMLLKEKEKENDYLKDLINSLKNQPQNVMLPGTTNEDLENEIKKIIEDKKNAVKKLSNMIIELKKTPSGNVVDAPDMTDVEKECKEMMGDLNNMNDKLNNVLQKLRQTPPTAQGEPVNKDDLLHNLNHMKRQCEEEIEALKNQVKDSSDSPVVLTGVGRVRIDDPELLKRKYPDSQLPDEPVNVPSNVQFYLYPSQGGPVQQPSRRRRSPEPTRPYEPDRYDEPRRYDEPSRCDEPTRYSDPDRTRIPDPTPESSLKSFRPVDYRPVSPEVSFRQLPIKPNPKERLYPEIPSETHSISPKPRRHVSCEACQEDYSPFVSHEDHGAPTPPPDRQPPTREKPKKKGCCGGKGSKTSNVPYEKSPEKEELVYIHQPEPSHQKQPKQKKTEHSHPPKTKKSDHTPQSRPKTPDGSPKPKRKLVSNLKLDRH